MRTLSIDRPFTAGMVTDLPAHEIGALNSVFAQDGFSPQGMFIQRKGWKYDGTVADVADNLVSVARVKFTLAAVTRTVTCDDDGDVGIHNASGARTDLFDGAVTHLPRCVYRDELLFCAQDGTTPLRRYGGAASGANITYSGTPTLTANQATLTGMTLGSSPGRGAFAAPDIDPTALAGIAARYRVRLWHRILESSTTSVTMDGAKSTITVALGASPIARFEGLGYSFPAVSVYDAGTVTYTDTTKNMDGFGTQWSTGAITVRGDQTNGADGVLVMPTSAAPQFFEVETLTDDDDLTVYGGGGVDITTKASYSIMRRLPFKDVAAHKNSLWGTGVAQYPSRVYVGPPNWNIAIPPGSTVPFDIAAPPWGGTFTNANDYAMDFIDVPAPDDTDAVVAILDSPNPLLVLKRDAVFGIYGSFGGLSVDMVADGIGCIDIRSAQSYDEGQFWAGESGIYWYTQGQVRDLTAGKINREWRTLTHDFDYGTSDFCTLWIASGHLHVGIITAGGTIKRTYVCDLRDGSWPSRFSNMTPRYGFSSRIPGEKEKALIVGGDIAQGRVADVAHCVDGGSESTAKDAAGSFPRLQAYTSSALAQSTGIDGLSRMVDLTVHANVVDAGSPGATQMTPTVVQGGGIANEADVSTALTAISSDTVDRIDRTDYRPAKQGRFHQVRLAVGTLGTDTNATKVEVAQIVCQFRDRSGHA